MSEQKKRKIEKKYWILAAVVVVIIILFAILRSNNQQSAYENLTTAIVENGDLIATVGGTGKVTANKSAVLSWKTSGNVSALYVDNGDFANKDQTLAELAQSSLPQSVILAQVDLVEARRNLETVLESNSEHSQAYIDLLDAEQNLKDAQENVNDWNYNNADQQVIDEARTAFIATEETLKQAETALQEAQISGEGDVEALQIALDETQFERDKALRNLNYILGKAYDSQVAMDFAEYDLALAQLEDAQREWERVKDGQNEDDIRAAQAKVTAAEVVANMSMLKAPFDGTITSVFINEGDEISSGTNAFRIDDLSKFFIEVDIPEIDIHKVEIGQEAEFTFDSILDKTYHGEVVQVSGAGIEDQGETNFTVKLLITDSDEDILPGMTASVSITVTRLENVLLVPNRAIRLDNGDIVVYVLRNGEIEQIIVEIGSSSDSYTQIISGDLAVEDILVLNPPEDFFNTSQRPAFTR